MPAVSAATAPLKVPHKFTVEEYHRLGEAGILGEDERVELIEGELIDMPPIGPSHASLANLLIRRLGYPTEGWAVPWAQSPIHLGPRSEPQPDFALLRQRADDYSQALPTAAEIRVVVEVAESSLDYDRRIKTPFYARAGIPEYWFLNLPEKRLEVHREPAPRRRRYREQRSLSEGSLASLAFPDLRPDIAELLR